MPLTSGVVAALTAPLLEAVGFLEWDIHWSKGGGSAFALNLYKCNLAALGFLIMAGFTNNSLYLDYSRKWGLQNSNPWGYTVEEEKNRIYQAREKLAMGDGLQELEKNQQSQLFVFENEQQQLHNLRAYRHHGNDLSVINSQPLNQNQQEISMQSMTQQSESVTLKNQPDFTPPFNGQAISQHGAEHIQEPLHGQPYIPFQPQQSQQKRRRLQFWSNADPPPYPEYDIKDLPDRYPSPFKGKRHQIPYLLLSSFLGIIIGDLAELEALRLVGARRVLVVDTIKPMFSAVLGHLLLGEPLYFAAFVGMILTGMGVYIVLIASLEKLEKVKDKQKIARIKRRGSRGELSALLDKLEGENTISGDNDDDVNDAEVAAIINELSVDSNNEIQMVGIRRRPLSRHDLRSDYEDAITSAEQEADDLMLLLEDGRGIINTTICCGGVGGQQSRSTENLARFGLRKRTPSGASWGSSGSWGSMGSFDSFDGDMEMNDISGDLNDGDEDDMEFFFGSNRKNVPNLGTAQDSTKLDVLVSMPLPMPTMNEAKTSPTLSSALKVPIKSALKKPRFGIRKPASSSKLSSHPNTKNVSQIEAEGKMLLRSFQAERSNFAADVTSTTVTTAVTDKSTLLIQQTNLDEQLKERDNYFPGSSSNLISTDTKLQKLQEVERPRMAKSYSTGSLSSFESECGPPPDSYNFKRKETDTERKIRLRTGYFLASLNVILDAYGSFLTKKYGLGMSTWEINLCRMGFAGVILLLISGIMRVLAMKKRLQFRQDRSSQPKSMAISWYRLPNMSVVPWLIVSIGVLFVTFFCPALTNYALFEIPLALAVTLTSVTPLYTVPLGWVLKGETPTIRGCIGAGISVLGVIIMCIWGLEADSLE